MSRALLIPLNVPCLADPDLNFFVLIRTQASSLKCVARPYCQIAWSHVRKQSSSGPTSSLATSLGTYFAPTFVRNYLTAMDTPTVVEMAKWSQEAWQPSTVLKLYTFRRHSKQAERPSVSSYDQTNINIAQAPVCRRRSWYLRRREIGFGVFRPLPHSESVLSFSLCALSLVNTCFKEALCPVGRKIGLIELYCNLCATQVAVWCLDQAPTWD